MTRNEITKLLRKISNLRNSLSDMESATRTIPGCKDLCIEATNQMIDLKQRLEAVRCECPPNDLAQAPTL